MSWIPALAAGGLILAILAVIIQVLFRWRYQVVHFAAFRLLMESRRRSRHRLRWEELILILLRVTACLLVGLMLADVRFSGTRLGRAVPTVNVFILDDSLSMGQQAAGTTLYQKACAQLIRRLEELPETDSVAVIFASRPRSGEPDAKLDSVAAARRANLAAQLAASKPSDLRADFPGALRRAADLLASRDGLPVRLYLLSDFRKADFTVSEAAARLQAALAQFDRQQVELSLLSFGLPCRNNLTVVQIALGRSVPVAGLPTALRVILKNTGAEPTAPTRLEVSLGDRNLPVQPVQGLGPGETAEVEVPCTFDSPGSAAVRVRLPADDLPADSDCALALEIRDALRILVVDGSPNPSDEQSASHALAQALDPSGRGSFGRRLDIQSATAWNPASLAAYDLVVLAGVREFAAQSDGAGKMVYPAVGALEDYVRSGGGLAIFVNENLNPAFYNGPMFADGRGLLPLALADRPPPTPSRESFVRLNPQTVRDIPMLRLFSGRGPNFARFVRFFGVVPADVEAPGNNDSPAEVLAAFDNGLPAVARRAYGKGHVLMWYTSPQPQWTNWSADLSFLPVINGMAWELARPAENEFDDLAGRAIGYTLPVRLSGTVSATLKTPEYPAEDLLVLALQDDGRQRSVAHPDPRHAGLYELTLTAADRTEQRVLFSRRPDPDESQLDLIEESELRAAVGRPCEYSADLAVESQTGGQPPVFSALWWVFLAALLAVLAVEVVLGLRFGHYVRRAASALELSR